MSCCVAFAGWLLGTASAVRAPLVLGVELPDGTSSSRMFRAAGTPFVMRRSSPCGCVTVTLVGGLAGSEVASALRAVAGRFLELVRAGARGFADCCGCAFDGLSSCWTGGRVPREDRRVETWWVSCALLTLSRAAGDFVLARFSMDDRRRGRVGLAITIMSRCCRGHFSRRHAQSCLGEVRAVVER